MAAWFLLLPLVAFAAMLVWALRRTRISADKSSALSRGEKPKFETTMGDLRDLRQALRPLQKDHRDD